MAHEENIPRYFVRVKSEREIEPIIKQLKNQTKIKNDFINGGNIGEDAETLDELEPEDLFKKAKLIRGMIQAGNNSPVLLIEAEEIMNILLKKKKISRYIYNKYFDSLGKD